MRWHTKPIMQLVVMLVVMSVIIGAQSAASGLLASNTKNIPVAQNENTELRKVAAEMADPTCPNTDPVQYALTENNVAIAPPKRMRYVDAPWEYDSLQTNYFSRTSQEGEFIQAGYGTKAENLRFRTDDPLDDTRVSGIMSSMFRYRPTAFKNAYVLKYSGAPQGPDTPHKGSAPAIEVPSKAGWPVCMPTTGYDIGGGYEAMVVAAESNRITLHIGIHEYMDGDQSSLGGCPLGQTNCKGGYWLYISGIAVDSDILSAYNGKKGIQQGAGLSQNITDRIQLPVVKPGRRLGTSQGDGVTVLLRDSGPVIYANKNFMWGGGFPEYDPGTTPTATPPAGATSTPPPGAPTATPTAVPTVVPPAAGKGKFRVTLTNTQGNLNCGGKLVAVWRGANYSVVSVPLDNLLQSQPITVTSPDMEPGIYVFDATYGQYDEVSGQFSKKYLSSATYDSVNVTAGTTNVSIPLTNPREDYAECIAAPTATPTTPPNATVTPTGTLPQVIASTATQIHLLFAGQCTNNALCDALLRVKGSAYTPNLVGQFDSNPTNNLDPTLDPGFSTFRLGANIGYTATTIGTSFTLHMDPAIDPHDQWQRTILKLPTSADNASHNVETFLLEE